MNLREKVIVGAMVLALVYGCFHFLAPAPDPTPGLDVPEEAQKRAAQFEQEQRLQLSEVRLGPHLRGVESAISTPWSGNPFAKRVTVADVGPEEILEEMPEEAPEEIPHFVYSGYLDIEGQTFAVINSRAYRSNDPLPGSPYRILSIGAKQVVLAGGEHSVTVKLNIEPDREEP